MVTVTPGSTAPLPSVALPNISPVLTCASADTAASVISRETSAPPHPETRLIPPPERHQNVQRRTAFGKRKGVVRRRQGAGVIMLASRKRTHVPSAFLRNTVKVGPLRRVSVPPSRE